MTKAARPYVKDGIEFDQIAVRGIRVAGFHGVLATEREEGQLFFADVIVHVNTRAAAAGDDLSRTVNYSDVADRTAEVLAGSPFKLIEAVAEHIARELLEIDGIECADVTVHKPQAPLHVEFQDVSVSIRRDLRDGSLSADKRIGSSAGFSDDPMDPGSGPVRDVMDERPAQPVGAVIALGGNIGDVEPTFRDALAALHRVTGIEMRAASPLFRTAPEGGADQPDYLNAVARVSTALSPRELLAACHGIELLHGRNRSVPGSARTLDLDIISYEGVTGESADLTLPHPRAHVRGFVLLPWSHMESEAVLPPHGRVTDLARQTSFEGVTLVAAQWPHVPAPDALAGSREQAADEDDFTEHDSAEHDSAELSTPEPSAPEPTADAGGTDSQPVAIEAEQAPAAPAPDDRGQPAPVGQLGQPVPTFEPDAASSRSAQSYASAPEPQSYASAPEPQSYASAPEPQAEAPPTTPVGYAPPSGYEPPADPGAMPREAASEPSAGEPAGWGAVFDASPQEDPQPQAQQQRVWQQPAPQQPGSAAEAEPAHRPSAPNAQSAPNPQGAPSEPSEPGVPRRASFGVLRQPQVPTDESDSPGSQ